MYIDDVINFFSSELYLVYYNDNVYLFSEYRFGDKSWDYGIYDHAKVGDTKSLVVPDVCVDYFMDYMIDFSLEDDYDVSTEDLNNFIEAYLCDWADLALKLNYTKLYNSIKDICNYFKDTNSLEEYTKAELQSKFSANEEEINYINLFNAEME